MLEKNFIKFQLIFFFLEKVTITSLGWSTRSFADHACSYHVADCANMCRPLHLSVSRHCASHLLDAILKKSTLWKVQKVAKNIPKNTHQRILFTNEKIFNVEEKFNRQNDHVYVKSCYEAKDKIPSHPTPIGNGLVRNFVFRHSPDSFLQCQHKNKWWNVLSHAKQCLTG